MADPCRHAGDYDIRAEVTRVLSDGPPRWVLKVAVRCTQCHLPFQFAGLPRTAQILNPSAVPNGTIAFLPVVPADWARVVRPSP